MHGDEQRFIDIAFKEEFITTEGTNVREVEKEMAAKMETKYAVGLSSGTAALHLGIRLVALKVYGTPKPGQGMLTGRKVFCSDMTFDATVNYTRM